MKSETEDSRILPNPELAPEDDFQYPDDPDDAPAPGANSGRAAARQHVFEMPTTLKGDRMFSLSVLSLYHEIRRGCIDLNPEYQRDVVWNGEKQMGLIDSIFAKFYIPPIIFFVKYEDSGEFRICLDGKQRLTSIQLFMDGIIPYRHPITNEKWWYKDASDPAAKTKSRRLIIPEQHRITFANRQIHCVDYEELDEEDEREIFRRVQLGVALSTAEKLHVINTPRSQFIRELITDYTSKTTLASFPWDRKRGADFRCFAQSVYCLFRWTAAGKSNGKVGDNVKTLGTLVQLEKWLGSVSDNSEMTRADEGDAYGESLPESFAAKARETFDVMVKLANTKEYSPPFHSHKKVSPAEIISIALLIYVHHVLPTSPSAKFTLAELSSAIGKMRADVRNHHADVRLNDKCGKTLVQFVKDISKETVVDSTTQQPSQNSQPQQPEPRTQPPSVPRTPARSTHNTSGFTSASISIPAANPTKEAAKRTQNSSSASGEPEGPATKRVRLSASETSGSPKVPTSSIPVNGAVNSQSTSWRLNGTPTTNRPVAGTPQMSMSSPVLGASPAFTNSQPRAVHPSQTTPTLPSTTPAGVNLGHTMPHAFSRVYTQNPVYQTPPIFWSSTNPYLAHVVAPNAFPSSMPAPSSTPYPSNPANSSQSPSRQALLEQLEMNELLARSIPMPTSPLDRRPASAFEPPGSSEGSNRDTFPSSMSQPMPQRPSSSFISIPSTQQQQQPGSTGVFYSQSQPINRDRAADGSSSSQSSQRP